MATNLSQIILQGGRQQAEAQLRRAEIEARRQEQSGDTWGRAFASIGEIAANIPRQMQQQRAEQQQEQRAAVVDRSNRLKLDEQERGVSSQRALSQAMSDGGTLEEITTRLAEMGHGDLVPIIKKQYAEADEASTKAQTAKAALEAAEADYFGGLAFSVQQWIDPADPNAGLSAAVLAIKHAKQAGHDTSKFEQFVQQSPTKLPQLVASLIAASPKYQGLATQAQNATNTATRLDTELPGMQADAAMKQRQLAGMNAQGITADQQADNLVAQRNADTARMNAERERQGAKAPVPTTDTMTSEYQNALSRALLNTPATRRGPIVQMANRLWSEGNTKELADVIRQAAVEGENVDTKNLVLGRVATLASIRDTRDILKELKAAGVPTGWLTGTAEDLVRRLGKTTNPQYVELSNRLMGTLINYRRAATGISFSQRESADYARMFPNYKNELPVNLSLIEGLEREMTTYDRAYWEHKLGKDGSKLVGVLPSSTQPGTGAKADPWGIR